MAIQSKLKSQQNRILGLLIAAKEGEVSLDQILSLRISQFGSRILELRALGFKITNRQESRDGRHHSFYRLEPGPSVPAPIASACPAESLQGSLERERRDDG